MSTATDPDTDYNNHSEKAVIADLEHVDSIKAELAAWRKGPWVLKRDHDAEVEHLRAALEADTGITWEARRAALQAVKEVAS